jgi:hypothetical protein
MEILNKLNPVRKEIEHYFGFLFDMGFKFRDTNFAGHEGMIGWEVILESSKCLIYMYQERSEIHLTFAPLNAHNAITMNIGIGINDQIDIKTMIFYLSKGQNFIDIFDDDVYRSRKKQFEALANLVKEHIDQITPYFRNYEFRLYQSEMLKAQKEYNRFLMRKHGLS